MPGTMTQVAQEAWTTYQNLTGRDSDDIKLLTDPFKSFTAATGQYDALAPKLEADKPDNGTVQKGVDVVTVMDGAFANLAEVIASFKAKDEKIIAGTVVDQGVVKAKYATQETTDQNLLAALNDVLYQCQLTVMAAKFGDG